MTASNGVQAFPETTEFSAQFSPILVEREIGASVDTMDMSVDATPSLVDADISATPDVFEASIDASPSTVSRAVGVLISTASKYVEAAMEPLAQTEGSRNNEPSSSLFPDLPFIPSIRGVVYFPFRVVSAYTYYVTLPIRFLLSSSPLDQSSEKGEQDQEKVRLTVSPHDGSSNSSEEGMDSGSIAGDA